MITSQRWKKSTYSNDSATCVELSNTLDAVRDSKQPNGPTLPVAALTAFVREVKTGRFDR